MTIKPNKIKCKHCKVAAGYYIRIRYSGVGNYHFFDDGTSDTRQFDRYSRPIMTDNSGFYDSATWKEYKTKYCSNCNHKLTQ